MGKLKKAVKYLTKQLVVFVTIRELYKRLRRYSEEKMREERVR